MQGRLHCSTYRSMCCRNGVASDWKSEVTALERLSPNAKPVVNSQPPLKSSSPVNATFPSSASSNSQSIRRFCLRSVAPSLRPTYPQEARENGAVASHDEPGTAFISR